MLHCAGHGLDDVADEDDSGGIGQAHCGVLALAATVDAFLGEAKPAAVAHIAQMQYVAVLLLHQATDIASVEIHVLDKFVRSLGSLEQTNCRGRSPGRSLEILEIWLVSITQCVVVVGPQHSPPSI